MDITTTLTIDSEPPYAKDIRKLAELIPPEGLEQVFLILEKSDDQAHLIRRLLQAASEDSDLVANLMLNGITKLLATQLGLLIADAATLEGGSAGVAVLDIAFKTVARAVKDSSEVHKSSCKDPQCDAHIGLTQLQAALLGSDGSPREFFAV